MTQETVAQRAVAEVRTVARALATLPGMRGTARAIAAAGGLPLKLVVRRLKAGSLPVPSANRVFTSEKPDCRARSRVVWCLTVRGREFVSEG